jgi:hypothetical protein
MDQLLVSKLFRHPSNIHSIAKFVRVKLTKRISPSRSQNANAKNLGEDSKDPNFEIPMLKIQYLSRTPFKRVETSFRSIQF